MLRQAIAFPRKLHGPLKRTMNVKIYVKSLVDLLTEYLALQYQIVGDRNTVILVRHIAIVHASVAVFP